MRRALLTVAGSDLFWRFERFWVPPTNVLDLSDAGFLRDPGDHCLPGRAPEPLAGLESVPALALLGEPGTGKSTELRRESKRISAKPAESGHVVMHVDLHDYSSDGLLYHRVFESPEFLTWLDGRTRLSLHLDGLDEALMRIDTVANLLASELAKLPKDRLSIRIACRTAVWPSATLGTALGSIWGSLDAAVMEIAPLRRKDVLEAVQAAGLPQEAFMRALFASEAVPFAIKPLTLRLLIRIYQERGSLPRSAVELFRQGCLLLCEDPNPKRREARRVGLLAPDKRFRVASRVAVTTALANRLAVWTGAEAEVLPNDVCVSRLAGSRETGAFGAFETSETNVREVLDTGLFNSRGDGRLGWAHKSFEDFLAAEYLLARTVPAETVLRALKHPAGGLIPQLSAVAGWVASQDGGVRSALIADEPLVLLRGDLTGWEQPDIAALTASLLALADHQQGGLLWFSETFARLKHAELHVQLRPFVEGASGGFMARRLALLIVERCGLAGLQPQLTKLAFDVAEEPAMRAAAVAALARCGDASAPSILLSLVLGEAGPDPHQEIKGNALAYLWPRHMTAEELFLLLTPADENYVGAYAMFLSMLPDTLRAADLVAALGWATELLQRVNYDSHFRDLSLADAIMARAWKEFEENKDVMPALAEHLVVRLGTYGELWRGIDDDARKLFVGGVAESSDRRRRFLASVYGRRLDQQEVSALGRAGFITHDDLEWLLNLSPAGASPDAAADTDTLLNFLVEICRPHDPGDFEAIYAAAPLWPALRARYAHYFDGISLDSDYAVQSRAMRDQRRAFETTRRPPISANPWIQVRDTLAEAEKGDDDAWWRLTFYLGLTPESRAPASDLDYEITGMPGWASADASTRQRLIAVAERYLLSRDPCPDDWIDLRPTPFNRRDAAGLRALVLLSQEAPDRYRQVSPTVWHNWASVITALPKESSTKPVELGQVILDATRAAPGQVAETVVRLIRADKAARRERQGAAAASEPVHYWIFQNLPKGCWGTAELNQAIFQEMSDPGNSGPEMAALLAPLVKAGYRPAIEEAGAWIADPSRPAVLRSAAGALLLSEAPRRSWLLLQPLLASDEDFARGVLDQVASQFHFDPPFYTALDEAAVADIYILLERLFPKQADPPIASGYVGPAFLVGLLRDGIPSYLVRQGTEASVTQLVRLSSVFPEQSWLEWELATALQTMRGRTWVPLSVAEVLAVTDRPGVRLVTSPGDLLEVLSAALSGLQAELRGAQNPVRGLWDRQGATDRFRPIDEDGLSDYVRLYLQRVLGPRGIFANREVEVGRVPGAPIGQRTDILVNAIRRLDGGETFDSITAVIETKGCWNPGLMTSLTDQLFSAYMRRLQAPVGIYLVGWFNGEKWDDADTRKRRGTGIAKDDALLRFRAQASALPPGFVIQPFVLDCSLL